MGRLEGKVAIVTGAGSGIGRATAARFVEEGAQVIAADLVGAEAVAAELGPAVTPWTMDVTDRDQVRDLVGAARSRFGRLDVLCNSAGISLGAGVKLADTDDEVFERVMAVNCWGTFLMMKHAIPLILEGGGGSIVNVASIGGFVTQGGSCGYFASKGAVVMLTKNAAVDYAKQGIRVNCVCPGTIDTPLVAAAMNDEVLTFMRNLHPMGRLGLASEVAATIAFLASDDASFTTGAAYVVDGGRTAT